MLYEIRVSFPEKGAQVNSCLMDSCLWVATRTQLSMRSNYAQEAACRCLLPCGARWWWWSRTLRQFMRTLVNRLHGLNIANLRIVLNPRSKTNKTGRCLVVVWHQEATFLSFPKLGHAEGAWSTKHFMKPFLETNTRQCWAAEVPGIQREVLSASHERFQVGVSSRRALLPMRGDVQRLLMARGTGQNHRCRFFVD